MTWRFSKHPGFLILGQILWLAQANNCRSTFYVCNFSSKVRILGSFAKIPLGPANIVQNPIFWCLWQFSESVISKNARLFDFRAKYHEVLNHTKHECHFLCTSLYYKFISNANFLVLMYTNFPVFFGGQFDICAVFFAPNFFYVFLCEIH